MGLMNVAEAREAYYAHSSKVSDVARQLGFAAIALIWLFQEPVPGGGYAVPDALLWPSILAVFALAANFLQYATAAVSWGAFARMKEKQEEVRSNPDVTFNAPRQLNWPGNMFWTIKLVAIFFAYVFLLCFLFMQFIGRAKVRKISIDLMTLVLGRGRPTTRRAARWQLQRSAQGSDGERLSRSRKAGLPAWGFVAAVLCSTLAITSCTMHLPDYEVRRLDSYRYTAFHAGLAAAVHPMSDSAESKKYFGVDLASNGILAVFLLVENRRASSSLLLQTGQFSLGVSSASKTPTSADVGSLHTLAAAVTVGSLLGGKLISDSHEIKHNFAAKEFQSTTLSPGESAEGFVYFALPAEATRKEPWLFELSATDSRSGEPIGLTVPFLWNPR